MKQPLLCHFEYINQLVVDYPQSSNQPNGVYSMNRSDLCIRLAELHPQLPAKEIELAIRAILDTLSATLSRGGRIEIRGFGSFGLNYRPPRQGRNPKNGNKVKVPAKYVPHFKVGKELRERVSLASAASFSAPVSKI
jgi:integration host factor subunit beta